MKTYTQRTTRDDIIYTGKVLIASLLIVGLVAWVARPADYPPTPYSELYAKFHDKISHGLAAKMYVGVKPAKGKATIDDLWLPSGSFALADGIYNCYQHKGKPHFELQVTLTTNAVPAVTVSASPFPQTRHQYTQGIHVQTVEPHSTLLQDGTGTVRTPTYAPGVVRRGVTRAPCTTG